VDGVWSWIEALQTMVANFQAGIYPDLGWWSYVLLGLLVATEGPLSTLIGATAASAGYLDLRWVFAATVIGNVVGDSVWYTVGYFGKTEWILLHGRWLGLRPHHVSRLVREMNTHAAKLIVFAKIAYGLIVPTLVAAGLARVPWRKWFPVVFVVETIWSILLVFVGYHATDFVQTFEEGLHAVGIALLFVVVGLVLLRMVRRRVDRQALMLDPLLQEPSKEIPRVRLNGDAWVTTPAESVETRVVEVAGSDLPGNDLLGNDLLGNGAAPMADGCMGAPETEDRDSTTTELRCEAHPQRMLSL
jgi:membrane protein DedA with SNARE-associated domain